MLLLEVLHMPQTQRANPLNLSSGRLKERKNNGKPSQQNLLRSLTRLEVVVNEKFQPKDFDRRSSM